MLINLDKNLFLALFFYTKWMPVSFTATKYYLLYTGFIEISFTYHTIHPYKVKSKKVKVKVTQSCPTLCDPIDYTVQGILQARILEGVAVPFSRGSSQPRDQTQASRIAGGFFTSRATGKPLLCNALCGINFAAACRCHQRKASQRTQKSGSENQSIVIRGHKRPAREL